MSAPLRYSLVTLIALVVWLGLLAAAGALIWVRHEPWICIGEVYFLIGLTVFLGGNAYDARRRPAYKTASKLTQNFKP